MLKLTQLRISEFPKLRKQHGGILNFDAVFDGPIQALELIKEFLARFCAANLIVDTKKTYKISKQC